MFMGMALNVPTWYPHVFLEITKRFVLCLRGRQARRRQMFAATQQSNSLVIESLQN